MSHEYSHGLTPAEQERFVLLSEECAEVIQAISKILRHGKWSTNPTRKQSPTNIYHLSTEIGHLRNAINMVIKSGDVLEGAVDFAQEKKAADIHNWLHHQINVPDSSKG